MIRIEKLRKQYDSKTLALDDINLIIEDSKFVALLGPSGCGKTTTLNCIAGLLEPTSGEIYFGERKVTNLQPKDRNIGMVFQSYALYPHLKVIDNIAFPLKQKGVGKEARYAKARKIAGMLQIEALLERKPSQLSGGQQQRVSMARALVKEPDVLLLDEPMSNLDARLKIEIRDEIRRIQQETGITSIIVTHDQEEAMAIADKIAILDNGHIQQYDTPERLYHYPSNLFVAKFMGNPPMNFVDAKLDADGTHVYGDGFNLTVEDKDRVGSRKFSGRDVKLGVRSHLMAVKTQECSQAMQMRLQIVENLGKELLISGVVGNSFVRVTAPEDHDMFMAYKKISASRSPYVWLQITGIYNIFDAESGINIGLEE